VPRHRRAQGMVTLRVAETSTRPCPHGFRLRRSGWSCQAEEHSRVAGRTPTAALTSSALCQAKRAPRPPGLARPSSCASSPRVVRLVELMSGEQVRVETPEPPGRIDVEKTHKELDNGASYAHRRLERTSIEGRQRVADLYTRRQPRARLDTRLSTGKSSWDHHDHHSTAIQSIQSMHPERCAPIGR
jgi:hypothetical protein